MAVINTNDWLEKLINDPIKICQKISNLERKDDPKMLYKYLQQFGMYRPNSNNHQMIFENLKKGNAWGNIEKHLQYYQNKWNGPDVPIYIFPIEKKDNLFTNPNSRKSGVSFPDKLFLFLSDIEDSKEIEALFIHEYHHVCRMKGINKSAEEYTLLDSIIMEGLAEDAVHEQLGSEYVANWSKSLSKDSFQSFWNKYIKKNLNIKKESAKHDQLLFGKGFLPKMLGYSCGYYLVRKYRETNPYTTKESFLLPSKKFVETVIEKA